MGILQKRCHLDKLYHTNGRRYIELFSSCLFHLFTFFSLSSYALKKGMLPRVFCYWTLVHSYIHKAGTSSIWICIHLLQNTVYGDQVVYMNILKHLLGVSLHRLQIGLHRDVDGVCSQINELL